MKHGLFLASLSSGALLLGCGGPAVGEDATSIETGATPMSAGLSETGAGGPTSGGPTTGAVPTTSPITGTGDDTTGTTGTTDGFVIEPDANGGTVECDAWEQDCPEGQKCAPWAEGGTAWNATRCVPVTGDQQPGEPCTAEGGGVSGLDDCIKGAMCWDVDGQGHGVCVAHCIGTSESPACAEPGFGCPLVSEGVLNLCLPTCDPLMQDCAGDDLCLPVSGNYFCVLDGAGDAGAVFDACEFANACEAGLICLAPAAASECDQAAKGCCLPMCSIAAGDALCPGVGQQCQAVYEPQPPGFEDVGQCSLPP